MINPALIGPMHAMQMANNLYLSGQELTLSDAMSKVTRSVMPFKPIEYPIPEPPEPEPPKVQYIDYTPDYSFLNSFERKKERDSCDIMLDFLKNQKKRSLL